MDGKITYEKFDQLANELREKRNVIQATLDGIRRTSEAYIASLDEALQLISKTGVLFEKLEQRGQWELLLHLVKQVVISVEGKIMRIELRPPFAYLHELSAQQDGTVPPVLRGSRNKKTSQVSLAGSINSIRSPERKNR